MRPLIVIAAAALLAACAATADPAPREGAPTGQMMTQGRAIAEQTCAQCHAIYATGASPNSIAPPLPHPRRAV